MGFVNSNQVFIGEQIASRDEALRFLAKQAVELGFAEDEKKVYDAFLIRESAGPTGLQWGFAIPHAKADVITKAGVVVLKLASAVKWETFDGTDVDICVALYVPGGEAATTHMRLLSQSAVMLMDEPFRAFLRESADPEAIATEINKRLEA